MTTKIILKLLSFISKKTRREVCGGLEKIVRNERGGYVLTDAQLKSIKERTERLISEAGDSIPSFIFHHKRYHKELDNAVWQD